MRRLPIVTFAIIGSLLMMSPATAIDTSTLEIASQHTSNSDFNSADTLTNVNVEGGSVKLDVPSSHLIDDFEDGDITTKSSDWDGWNGDTGSFTAQSSTVLNGTQSGELSTSSDSAGVNTTRSSATNDNVRAKVQIDSQSGDSADASDIHIYKNDVSGTRLVDIRFVQDGNIEASDGGSLTDIGLDWSANSLHKVNISFDFPNDNYTVEINGTTKGPFSLESSASDWDTVRLRADTNTANTNAKHYIDDVETFRTGADTGTYISQNHTNAEQIKAGVTNLTLANATAIVDWQFHDGTSWTSANESTFSSTGNHSLNLTGHESQTKWRVNVTFTNETGSTTAELHDEAVMFNASKPTLTNADPRDKKKLETKSPELSIQLNDSDFGLAQSDSVTLDWFVNGSKLTSQTVSSNGTYKQTAGDLSTGLNNWTVNVTDNYGVSNYSDADGSTSVQDAYQFKVPGLLEIRNETTPSNLITDSVTVEIFASNETLTKTTTDGSINFSNISDDRVIVSASSSNFFTRELIIKDIYTDTDMYLLNSTTAANIPSAEATFTLDDETGNFPREESSLFIDKPITRNGNTTWTTVASDDFGASGITIDLEDDKRYRLTVENDEGDSRSVGPYVTSGDESVSLTPGAASIDVDETAQGVSWGAEFKNQSGTQKIVFDYSDPDNLTDSLTIEIYERSNQSNVIHDVTISGPLGNHTETKVLSGDQPNKTWTVNWTADYDDDTIGGKATVAEQFKRQLSDLDTIWQEVFASGIVLLIAGAFSRENYLQGSIVVPLVAGSFWYIGWLSNVTSAAAITAAIGIVILYQQGAIRR